MSSAKFYCKYFGSIQIAQPITTSHTQAQQLHESGPKAGVQGTSQHAAVKMQYRNVSISRLDVVNLRDQLAESRAMLCNL
jgi:predicted Zn-dependent protease